MSENYITVKDANNSKWGLLDHNGYEIISPMYDHSFFIKDNGIGIVCQDGRWGCVNKDNVEIIPFDYDKIVCKQNGYIEAYTNNTLKIYDDSWELTKYSGMQIIDFYNLYITCLTNGDEMMVDVKDKYYLKNVIPNVIIKNENKKDVKKQLVDLCSQIANYLLGNYSSNMHKVSFHA